MELVRMAIVYPHLLACCVAVGLVLTSDVAMITQLFRGGTGSPQQREHLHTLQRTVAWALVVLWITGVAIISLDASSKGWSYFLNPKLQAKIGIVALLTLNGGLLHGAVLPALQRAGSILHLPFGPRLLAVFAGVVSAVSWLYAAMLGIGRPLNWKYSLVEILGAYPVLVAGGLVVMLSLLSVAKSRHATHRGKYAY